jgi:hypothetical protein
MEAITEIFIVTQTKTPSNLPFTLREQETAPIQTLSI